MRRNPERAAAAAAKVIPIIKQIDADNASERTDHKAIIAKYVSKVNNRKTAIRAFCIQCSNGQPSEVRYCKVSKCALFAFRMGNDPFNLKSIKSAAAKNGSDEPEDDNDDNDKD